VRCLEEVDAVTFKRESCSLAAAGIRKGLPLLCGARLTARTDLVMSSPNIVSHEGVQGRIDRFSCLVFLRVVLSLGCNLFDWGLRVRDCGRILLYFALVV